MLAPSDHRLAIIMTTASGQTRSVVFLERVVAQSQRRGSLHRRRSRQRGAAGFAWLDSLGSLMTQRRFSPPWSVEDDLNWTGGNYRRIEFARHCIFFRHVKPGRGR
jgi:hypothetical protein